MWEKAEDAKFIYERKFLKPHTVKATCVHHGSILFLFKQLFCGLSESVKQVGL